MNDTPNPWNDEPESQRPRRRGFYVAIFLGAVALAAFLLNWRFPQALDGGGDWASLGYMFVILSMVSFGLSRRRESLPRLVSQAGIWLALALVIGTFYAYRYELGAIRDRLIGELVPGMGQEAAGG